MTQKDLAKRINKDVKTIGNWKRENEELYKLLLYGLEHEKNIKSNKIKAINQQNELVEVNVYENVNASAGYGNNIQELISQKMYFDKNFLKEFFHITNYQELDIIKVIGDSMNPSFKDGEYIIVERETLPKNGDTIIANIEDELYIKKYCKIPFEKWINLESENAEYKPIILDSDEKLQALNVIGIVRSKIKLY